MKPEVAILLISNSASFHMAVQAERGTLSTYCVVELNEKRRFIRLNTEASLVAVRVYDARIDIGCCAGLVVSFP